MLKSSLKKCRQLSHCCQKKKKTAGIAIFNCRQLIHALGTESQLSLFAQFTNCLLL